MWRLVMTDLSVDVWVFKSNYLMFVRGSCLSKQGKNGIYRGFMEYYK